MITVEALAKRIDHTNLKPDASERAIRGLCAEAREHHFISVCVHPCWVSVAAAELEDTGVRVATVIGFPHGANTAAVKAHEAEDAIRRGANDLDMVIALGAIKSNAWLAVREDIAGVVQVAEAAGAEVKVILECTYLTDEEMRFAAHAAVVSGAHFLKTSTGFGPHGARIEDVRLLADIAGGVCGVKAAGGIRDLDAALAMLEAGATRLGTSAGVSILNELASRAEVRNE